eukprot:2921167-Prorocentrum_lima.AAC.1
MVIIGGSVADNTFAGFQVPLRNLDGSLSQYRTHLKAAGAVPDLFEDRLAAELPFCRMPGGRRPKATSTDVFPPRLPCKSSGRLHRLIGLRCIEQKESVILEQRHRCFCTVRPRCHGSKSEDSEAMQGVPLLNLRFCKVLVTDDGLWVHYELVPAPRKCANRLLLSLVLLWSNQTKLDIPSTTTSTKYRSVSTTSSTWSMNSNSPNSLARIPVTRLCGGAGCSLLLCWALLTTCHHFFVQVDDVLRSLGHAGASLEVLCVHMVVLQVQPHQLSKIA